LSIDECVCSEQTTTRRSGSAARAAASADSVAIDAVSSMWPCHSDGRPSSCPSHPRRPLLELGERRPGAPEDSDLIQRDRQQLGQDRRIRRRVREVREKARMLPVRDCGEYQPVQVVQQRRERLARLRRRLGQPLEQPPWLDLRKDGQLADPLEVRRDPLERCRTVAPQVDGRRFLIRSICFHVRVFTTSAFVSHARRAWPIPNST
jgi:hypothetical protein